MKRNAFSLNKKLEIIKQVDSNSNLTYVVIAKDICIPVSTLNGIIKQKEEIISQIADFSSANKKMRLGKYEKIYNILLTWFKKQRSQIYQ